MTTDTAQLSRRERQIMEIVYELGRATAVEVRERMPDPPSYSAVRRRVRWQRCSTSMAIGWTRTLYSGSPR
jgi:hypothetical protein